jgi:phenylacetic acid degradation protein paaN
MHRYFEAHRAMLDGALKAVADRTYWSAAPETPSGKIYGETAKADGDAAFKAQVGKPFEMDHPGSRRLGKEQSPWGFTLGVTYLAASVDELMAASRAACAGWAAASIESRTGVCLEVIHRLNKQSFVIANAVQHTSGQPFMMAFQAGGPHAQDRALEAVAYAYQEMTKVPARARWEKPQGGGQEPLRLDKVWRIVPRGIAVTIGCSTFPTWNSYPGMFASLATGNTVIVKPHPAAILPLAITVRICRDVLEEAGFDPNVVLLAVDEASAPVSKELITHPDAAIVDFTGSPTFGRWVRENAKAAQVYTEEAGVNSIVIDSTSSFKGMCANIAFSLVLYSGQMCTAPQDIFVPRDGIDSDEGHKSFEDVARGIAGAVEKLIGNSERAAALLGTIQSEATADRVRSVSNKAKPLLPSRSYEIAGSPGARTATPAIFLADAADASLYGEEQFGPISFVVATSDTREAIDRSVQLARSKGAITGSVYSTSEAVLEEAADKFAAAGVNLSCNLTGGIFVNQSAAFSDFHVSGANPAGNACLTDAAFVANRFRAIGIRRPAAA